MSGASEVVQSPLVRLGEVLRFHREQRGLSVRNVADRVGQSAAKVEAWERGDDVPDERSWGRYKAMVHRKLNEFGDLRQRAIEQLTQRKPNERTFVHRPLEKLADVVPLPVAQPDPEPRTIAAPVEARSFGAESQSAKRQAFALDILRQRPSIRARGADSLDELVRRTFGVGLSNETVMRLRAQVERERASVSSVARTRPAVPAQYDAAADVGAAVSLLLEAIPTLQSFTLEVDERGEASVQYQVRKEVVRVETVGGSLRVKRDGAP